MITALSLAVDHTEGRKGSVFSKLFAPKDEVHEKWTADWLREISKTHEIESHTYIHTHTHQKKKQKRKRHKTVITFKKWRLFWQVGLPDLWFSLFCSLIRETLSSNHF